MGIYGRRPIRPLYPESVLVIYPRHRLFYIQVVQMRHGQTMHERKHEVTCYDLGWKGNVKEILGDRWYLTWISCRMKTHYTYFYRIQEVPYFGVLCLGSPKETNIGLTRYCDCYNIDTQYLQVISALTRVNFIVGGAGTTCTR